MDNYLKDDFIDEVKGCLGKEGDGSGQANVIESIKVNGVDQSVDSNKSVDIPVPTKTSDLDNDSGYMTEDQVNNKVTEGVASIVADAPEDFDTLKEMSDWLTKHDESAAAMNTSIKKNADDITALQTSKADQEDVDAVLEDVGEINSNLHDLEFEGWTIPDGMPLNDISKVGRVDLSTLTWNYDSTNNRYTSDDISNSAKFVDDSTVATNLYCTTQHTNKSANDVWAGTNGVAIGSAGTIWYKNESTSSTVKPSGYLYYELATAKTQTEQNAFDKLNESLADYRIDNKCDGVFEQGGYDGSNGSYFNNDSFIRSVHGIKANSGDTLVAKTPYEYGFACYSSSTPSQDTFLGYVSLDGVAPQGTQYVFINLSVSSGSIRPTDGINTKVYVNNAIDEINSNLDTLEFGEVAGGKNLLECTATSNTVNGITWTVNNDGSITANGTATSDSSFGVNIIDLDIGVRYAINGAPSGSSSTTYFLESLSTKTWSSNELRDYGSGFIRIPDDSTGSSFAISCMVKSGTTVENLTFYPMVRYADIEDDTYEPYIQSVKMLAEEVSTVKQLIAESQVIKNYDFDKSSWIENPSNAWVKSYMTGRIGFLEIKLDEFMDKTYDDGMCVPSGISKYKNTTLRFISEIENLTLIGDTSATLTYYTSSTLTGSKVTVKGNIVIKYDSSSSKYNLVFRPSSTVPVYIYSARLICNIIPVLYNGDL